jgi:hypothetical protein
MNALIRGSIKRCLDRLLDQTALDSALEMFRKGLSPTVRNLDDALFGYVVGRLIEFALNAIKMFYGRQPTSNEIAEIDEIIKRKAIEIKSRITLITHR